jgi:hypothetical protein
VELQIDLSVPKSWKVIDTNPSYTTVCVPADKLCAYKKMSAKFKRQTSSGMEYGVFLVRNILHEAHQLRTKDTNIFYRLYLLMPKEEDSKDDIESSLAELVMNAPNAPYKLFVAQP